MQGQVERQAALEPAFGTAATASARRPLAGLTVLVVEDSRIASEAVRLICLRSGARVRRADCLASARRHLATYRPAVVLVDMGLPDGDGAELIAAIAAIEPQVPVILGISGEPDRRDSAIAAGAQGFLAKPVESVALFQQTILSALPSGERPAGLRLVPSEIVVPDAAALRDDLIHAMTLLEDGPGERDRNYLGRFVAGVARSARDAALEDAAESMLEGPVMLAADGNLSPAVTRLQALLRRRVQELSPAH